MTNREGAILNFSEPFLSQIISNTNNLNRHSYLNTEFVSAEHKDKQDYLYSFFKFADSPEKMDYWFDYGDTLKNIKLITQ